MVYSAQIRNLARHAVVNMKASMSEEARATEMYQTFDVEATGWVITSSLLTWSEGLYSFPNTPSPPTLIAVAGNPVNWKFLTDEEALEELPRAHSKPILWLALPTLVCSVRNLAQYCEDFADNTLEEAKEMMISGS